MNILFVLIALIIISVLLFQNSYTFDGLGVFTEKYREKNVPTGVEISQFRKLFVGANVTINGGQLYMKEGVITKMVDYDSECDTFMDAEMTIDIIVEVDGKEHIVNYELIKLNNKVIKMVQ